MSQLNVQNRWRTPSEAGEKITWLSSSESVKGDTSEGSVVALGFQTAVALKTGDYSNDHNFTDMVGFDSPRQKIGMAGQIGRALRAFIEPTGRTESNNISNKPNNFNHYNKTSQDSKENIDKHHSLLCALRDFLGEQESVVLFDTSQLVKDQEEQMSEDVIGAEGSLQHSGTSAGAVVPVKEEEGGQQAHPEGPSTAGSAALSPASLYSTEFCSGPYTFQQFDCQSDCTESTGYFPTTPKSSSVVVTNRKRSKSCSLDSVFSDFASPHRQHQQQRHQQSQSDPASELWESDISIFNKSSESANYFVLPSPGAESDGAQSSADCHTNKMPTATDSDSAVESSDQRGTGIGDSDSGTSGRAKVSAQSSKSFSSGASAGDLSTTSMPSATPVYAERSEDSSSSSVEEELPNAPTDDATRAPLPSSQRQRDRSSLRSGEVCPVIAEPLTPPALQAHGTSDANTSAARTAERAAAAVKKIDLLVLPTALPDDARSCVYTALSTLDVQVQRVQR